MQLSDFWGMTPWQLGVVAEAYSEKKQHEIDHGLGFAWHTAAFTRAKKLPSLKEILDGTKQPMEKNQLDGMMGHLKAYQAQRDKAASND